MLKNVENQFRSMLPHDNGLLLQPVRTHRIATAKKACRNTERYSWSLYMGLFLCITIVRKTKVEIGDFRIELMNGERHAIAYIIHWFIIDMYITIGF